MLSHLQLLEEIEEDVFMIIEDDILTLGTRDELDAAIEQLPDNWDMLYLGAELHVPLERYSDNLFRLKRGKVTHAIIYNNQNNVVDYILDHCFNPIDEFYAEVIQERFNCFITDPMICTQNPGYSDTIRWWKNYDEINKNYKLYAK